MRIRYTVMWFYFLGSLGCNGGEDPPQPMMADSTVVNAPTEPGQADTRPTPDATAMTTAGQPGMGGVAVGGTTGGIMMTEPPEMGGEQAVGGQAEQEMGGSMALAGTPSAPTPMMPDPLEENGMDSDGDGLDDGWERGVGDQSLLDPNSIDTDGDGVPDGEEDFDNDGLTNQQEQAAGRLERAIAGHRPHPLRADLLIEVDTRANTEIPLGVLETVRDAFQPVTLESQASLDGLAVHFYLDERELELSVFNANFGPRKQALASSRGLKKQDWGPAKDELDGLLVHMVIAGSRSDKPERAGETIGEPPGSPEGNVTQKRLDETGILIYADTLSMLFPDGGRCGAPADGSYEEVADVTYPEAFSATIIHEIGHALQLGHDTEVGGGINEWNVMSTPSGCPSLRRRIHGEGNEDQGLGSTENVFAPRFSDAAEALMEIGQKLGVETPQLFDQAM